MKEKLKIHKEIEREDAENRRAWLYWNSIPVGELETMIAEKDRLMEWDDQFGFLCELLDSKKEAVQR